MPRRAMLSDAFKLNACLQYLRRTYYLGNSVWNVAALRELATAAFNEASQQVTITQTNSELGGGSGVVTFEKWILIGAIETLLREVDPANTPAPPPTGSVPDHSAHAVEV